MYLIRKSIKKLGFSKAHELFHINICDIIKLAIALKVHAKREKPCAKSKVRSKVLYNAKVPLQIAFIKGKTMKIINRLARKGERGNIDEIIP